MAEKMSNTWACFLLSGCSSAPQDESVQN